MSEHATPSAAQPPPPPRRPAAVRYTRSTLVATSSLTFLVGVLIGVTLLAATIKTRPGDADIRATADDAADEDSNDEPTRPAAASVAPPAPPPEKTPAEKLLAVDALDDALAITKPLMRDTHDELDKGMLALGLWSLDHLTWKDVAVVQDETTVKSTMKDPDAARGKRMCTRGSLIQIEVFKVDGKKGFEGLMWNHRRELIKFIASQSTGELVKNSPARFCGIVTGKYS